MNRWELIECVAVPEGGEMRLYRRDSEYSIRVDGQELMNSRLHGSEEELAHRVCARLVQRRRPRVLVGGLGMGYTLSAVLASLDASAEVTVAELVPAVVTWNLGPLRHLANGPLLDPRVIVQQVDVASLLFGALARYDAVLLDVDNGPEGLTRGGNGRLYSLAGLLAIRRALTAGGCFGVWSAGPDRRFGLRLRQAGFDVSEARVSARGADRGGGRHTLWIGALQPQSPNKR